MFFLALKHLLSRPKQTLITLSGVMLGVAAYVAFSGLMNGFQGFIIDQLVNNDSHVRISAKDTILDQKEFTQSLFNDKTSVFWITPPSGIRENPKIINPLGWFAQLNSDHRVAAYSPQIQNPALFTKGPISIAGRVVGIDPRKQMGVTNIESYMTQGNFLDIGRGGNRMIIGDSLLQKMGARIGDNISISTGSSTGTPFKVIGAFHIGVHTIDQGMAFAYLPDVQAASLRHSQISDIAIRLTDVNLAQEIAKTYSLFTQDKVESWDQANANILSVFTIQNLIRNFVTISILIVAAFGIYNILNILVNQKRKDIGILRSIGFDENDILKLFLIQGLVLGGLGGFMGLVFGWFLSYILSIIDFVKGFADHMIISFAPSIYISGLAMAISASVFSSYLPARAAGKLKPIDIIRSGE